MRMYLESILPLLCESSQQIPLVTYSLTASVYCRRVMVTQCAETNRQKCHKWQDSIHLKLHTISQSSQLMIQDINICCVG